MFGAASGISQMVGPVESEELPDYESDEEVTIDQHADNNLDDSAPIQESAMIPPPAGHFQEGQESSLPAVASICLLYTSPSPRDGLLSRMPSSA